MKGGLPDGPMRATSCLGWICPETLLSRVRLMYRSFEEGSRSLAGTFKTLVMLVKVRVMGVSRDAVARSLAKFTRAFATSPIVISIDCLGFVDESETWLFGIFCQD